MSDEKMRAADVEITVHPDTDPEMLDNMVDTAIGAGATVKLYCYNQTDIPVHLRGRHDIIVAEVSLGDPVF